MNGSPSPSEEGCECYPDDFDFGTKLYDPDSMIQAHHPGDAELDFIEDIAQQSLATDGYDDIPGDYSIGQTPENLPGSLSRSSSSDESHVGLTVEKKKCGNCGNSFVNKHLLSRHQQTACEFTEHKKFGCPLGCGYETTRPDHVSKHLTGKRKHNKSEEEAKRIFQDSKKCC